MNQVHGEPMSGKLETRASRLFKNMSFLTVAKVLGDLANFVFFVMLTRTFGEEGIGQYSFAVAFSGFFMIFADFGLYTLTVKELGRNKDSTLLYYGRMLSLRLILCFLTLTVLLFVLPFLPFPGQVKQIIIFIGLYHVLCTVVDGFGAIFVAHEESRLAGFLDLALRGTATVAGTAILLVGADLVTVTGILPIVSLVYCFLGYGLVAKRYGSSQGFVSWPFFLSKLQEAVPYVLSGVITQTSARVDVLLLGILLSMVAAGIYNVGYRFVFFLLFLPQYGAVVLLPFISRLYESSRKDFQTVYVESLTVSTFVGIPASLGLWLLAPVLVDLIFGQEFIQSAHILRILAALFYLACLKSVLATFLVASNLQVTMVRWQGITGLVNVILNLLLIPKLGMEGAAIATLFSEILLVILFFVRLKPVVGWPRIGSNLTKSCIASSSFCLLFTVFPDVPLLLLIPSSVIIYISILLLFKDIRRNEIPKIKRLLVPTQ